MSNTSRDSNDTTKSNEDRSFGRSDDVLRTHGPDVLTNDMRCCIECGTEIPHGEIVIKLCQFDESLIDEAIRVHLWEYTHVDVKVGIVQTCPHLSNSSSP